MPRRLTTFAATDALLGSQTPYVLGFPEPPGTTVTETLPWVSR